MTEDAVVAGTGRTAVPAMSERALRGLPGALVRYRIMAYFTGVLLAFMTVVGLPYKYLFDGDPAGWYAVGWIGHGWAYILYVAFALDLVFRMRWNLLAALGVVLAGTIPFMSFVAEYRVRRSVEARLAAAGA
jgi:integral membrane protein